MIVQCLSLGLDFSGHSRGLLYRGSGGSAFTVDDAADAEAVAIDEMKNGGYGFHSTWENIVNYIKKLNVVNFLVPE